MPKLFSDSGASLVKELEQKLKCIRTGIQWFTEHSLDPGRLEAGGEDGS